MAKTPGELGDISVLDCGCRAITYTDSPWPDLDFCLMHKAAPELLESCQEMYGWLCQEMPAQQPGGWEGEMMAKARAAIDAATKEAENG